MPPQPPPPPQKDDCPECNGSGVKFAKGGKPVTCRKCGGSGKKK